MGLPQVDSAVSWMAVGYADLGIFGCLIYGVIFAMLLVSIVKLAKKSKGDFLIYVATAQACYAAYNIEADPLMLFATLRDILILYLICYLVSQSVRVHAGPGRL